MNLDIDPRYNTYSLSIVLHLLHNNLDYNKLWISKYPQTESQASNFFKNSECGCRPVLVRNYKKFRFSIDCMTVDFINQNPSVLDFDNFCKTVGGQDLRGTIFSVENTESAYKDFVATLLEKKSLFSYYNTVSIGDRILITFF